MYLENIELTESGGTYRLPSMNTSMHIITATARVD
jgi:hypothetical protein